MSLKNQTQLGHYKIISSLGAGGMGEEAFEAAFSEGKAMRLKKAIALARESS